MPAIVESNGAKYRGSRSDLSMSEAVKIKNLKYNEDGRIIKLVSDEEWNIIAADVTKRQENIDRFGVVIH